MGDTSALAALVIAVAALFIAAIQLTQQLMATAYVIRKCDRIVTGGLTKGGIRQWHWRQFRFTVKYQAIIFTLPTSIYSALGISSSVQIDETTDDKLWNLALKLRPSRTSSQACWISFAQDMIVSDCIGPENICIKEESGDRIPEDLTVAGTRADALTVMLSCVAFGMQVFKYSPTTGEITLAGGVGAISSSIHPVLGGLLHYTVFSDEPKIGYRAASRHGRALRQEKGVWANTVFGRFKDRSYRPDIAELGVLRTLKLGVLRVQGWPEDSYTDTIGGAACFMAFAHVDVYEAVPASCVRRWCAHFAEVIVKAHHREIIKKESEALDGACALPLSNKFCHARQSFVDIHGCSSPYLPWETWNPKVVESLEKGNPVLGVETEIVAHIESRDVLISPELLECLHMPPYPINLTSLESDESDPSSYVPMPVACETILRADQCMRHVYIKYGQRPSSELTSYADKIVARAISSLSEAGAPSWGGTSSHIENWETTFNTACEHVLTAEINSVNSEWVSIYARLSILRAAYYTIMMRAAGEIGQGLTEGTMPDTALVYMA